MSVRSDIQIQELKDLITTLRQTIDLLNKTIEDVNARNEALSKQLSDLLAERDFLKQKLFGSTSEPSKTQLDGQMSLDLFGSEQNNVQESPQEEDEKDPETVEGEFIDVAAYKKQKKHKATYDEVFADLPKKTVEVDTLTDEQKTCVACGEKMVPIGHEVLRTELIYTPAKLERIEYIGTTWACPNCKDTEDNEFVKDTGRPALLEGSYVSSGLAAHVMYAKYVLALPLYRLEKDFEHLGAKINRTTMANWVIECSSRYFRPMYNYLHRKLLERKYLAADETPIQVLKEEDRRPQSKSYVWLIRTGEDTDVQIILYNYTPTRARYNIAEFLKGKEDPFYLMVDGYQGYNNLPNAIRCCCYAHIRRYFVRAIPKGHDSDMSEPAVQGVMYCDKLFRYEAIYAAKGYSAMQIQKRRIKDQEPIIDAFLKWADQQKPKNGDRIIKALNYLNNCRPYMKNYLQDGNCSLSNNISENSIRPVVLGRKNWLFSDTPDGALASMTVFSLVETAKANDLDQEKYLEFLLEQRPNEKMSDEDLEAIAPWSDAAKNYCKKKME